MARRVRDAILDSKEARRGLEPRSKPYFRVIERGLHVGYRRLARTAGTWVARHYVGHQDYEHERLGTADDLSDAIAGGKVGPKFESLIDADGAILNFWQAVDKARRRMVGRTHAAAGHVGPLTVNVALDDYLDFLVTNRKTADDSRYRTDALIRPVLGDVEVATITAKQIRKWHADLAKSPARLRTRKGEAQQYRKLGTDAEAIRRRKSSADRTLKILKAALNRAWREHPKQVPSNAEWARVERFKEVDVARVRYLSLAEAKRLGSACDPVFRPLVQGGLQTGARYGELARLDVADFDIDSGTIVIRESKGGKPRHVVLTDEGLVFFRQLTAGRAGNEPMFVKRFGARWGKSHQKKPMADACARAKISPPVGFHQLRHTWASHAVMNGVPLMVVARNLGHRDTKMVEQHYGHLAPSYIADAIRAGAPKFGFKPDPKIATLQ
jgi:integrase